MNKSTHYVATLGGAIVLVTAVAASSGAQKYSEWSTPINLGPNVNSSATDRGPAISKDGLSLYFASSRPGGQGEGTEDIYVSQRETRDDEWGPAMNLGPIINTPANEQVPAFSRDGHLMFFTSNRLGGLPDIWVSRREQTHDDFAWQPAENLGAAVNSAGQDEGPSYFQNDDVGVPQLYFSGGMTRPGGPGIFVSEQMADGSFGPAVLVPELSGLGNSQRPSIRHDGLEIFFTNSQDLWVATRATVFDAWSAPVNLGSPLNTALVDVQPYISSGGETLFFASNRPGGGPTDIYMSTRTKLRGK